MLGTKEGGGVMCVARKAGCGRWLEGLTSIWEPGLGAQRWVGAVWTDEMRADVGAVLRFNYYVC